MIKETRFFIVIIVMFSVIGVPGQTSAQTEKPCVTIKTAVLYSGPYSSGSRVIARLPADTTVMPIAAYGDFIRVKVTVEGAQREGFIQKDLLWNLPNTLPQLKQDTGPVWLP
jgi:hypothetical protein